MATKKLINSCDTCVDESLIGFASAHPFVKKLKGFRVTVRSDLEKYKTSGKVALISGGGSGHEPLFAGFVGSGFLTASIAGSVFTSPPPKQILAAMNAAQTPAGIIVFIANYTGDRLNFGISIQRFGEQSPEVPISSVIIADDCALTSSDKSAGRRGLSGITFVLKISGAMAEHGKSIDEIVSNAKIVVENLGTIGLSLSSCSVPGQGPMFSLKNDEMELGLGVHGEPGVKRMKLQSAKDTVEIMLKHLTDVQSETSLKLNPDDAVAVMINNLGGLTQLEINLLCGEVINWFESKRIGIKRFYVGAFMTSLEMQGFSISVLRLKDKQWLKLLDAETNCASWPKTLQLNSDYEFSTKRVEVESKICEDIKSKSTSPNTSVDYSSNDIRNCLLSICDVLVINESYLNDLDKRCGDGDCGATMKSGALAIKSAVLNNELNFGDASLLLKQMSEIWENNTGGTAGAIYSLLLSAASKSLKNDTSFFGWLSAVINGTSVIMDYGGAQSGDRTMIDSLLAVVQLARNRLESKQLPDKNFCSELINAVDNAAESTKLMSARAGRASYVAKSNLTSPDPGAVAVALWIKAIANFYLKKL